MMMTVVGTIACLLQLVYTPASREVITVHSLSPAFGAANPISKTSVPSLSKASPCAASLSLPTFRHSKLTTNHASHDTIVNQDGGSTDTHDMLKSARTSVVHHPSSPRTQVEIWMILINGSFRRCCGLGDVIAELLAWKYVEACGEREEVWT